MGEEGRAREQIAKSPDGAKPDVRIWQEDESPFERVATGLRWAEGPVYFPAGRYLVWSDIPNDRVLRFDETDGSVSVFCQPAMYSNGHTVDLQGRLVSCEHLTRCVSRTEFDGSRTVLADRYDGAPILVTA